MKPFLVRIAGCNFDATAFDTADLSTVRGASLAYLRHAEAWPARLASDLPGIETIVTGASEGIYRVEADIKDNVEAAVARVIGMPQVSDDPLDATRPHLTFAHAVVEETADDPVAATVDGTPAKSSYARDVARLVAICRARQLQQVTVDIPETVATGDACPYDRVRPVAVNHRDQRNREVEVSASVHARRTFGRSARATFYDTELPSLPPAVVNLGYADSFEDLVRTAVADAPGDTRLTRLPPALRGKHAVIYLDGNSFTAIREKVIFEARVGDTREAMLKRHRDFSNAVEGARRKLLAAMLEVLGQDVLMRFEPDGRQRTWDARDRLKFETLLWGGDEVLFVLPAWKVLDVLPVIASELEGDVWRLPPELGPHKLSHAVGIVVCNIKTPIAVTRSLAQEVADDSKILAKEDGGRKLPLEALRNVFSIQTLESVEPPRANLGAFRQRLYGTKTPEAFTLVARAGVDGMLGLFRQLQSAKGGLPRSQLFKLIDAARKAELLASGKEKAAEDFLGAKVDDPRETALAARACRRSGCTQHEALRSALLGYTQEAPLMPLIRLAELWDYVDPVEV